MPRTKRIIPLNAALHVISRGNNRQKVFHNDNDKLRYYSLLNELKEGNRVEIFNYCLMNNHIHLILGLNAESALSKFMKQINLTYCHYYSKMYGYSGHLWQDRFRSNIIELDSYLLQCGKYIELNPVQAGVVDYPEDYSFSSYCFYAKGRQDALITSNPAYLGLSDFPALRQKQYADFVVNSNIVNSGILEKKIYIGSEAFINRLQEVYQLKNRREKKGRPPKK